MIHFFQKSLKELAFVAIFWSLLQAVTGVESPLVVVLSGSMEPAYFRGDVLLLAKRAEPVVGDIVVFRLPEQDIPVVHRVMQAKHDMQSNQKTYLTKGDNNKVSDESIYKAGGLKRPHLVDNDIVGNVVASIPLVGYATIYMQKALDLIRSPKTTIKSIQQFIIENIIAAGNNIKSSELFIQN